MDRDELLQSSLEDFQPVLNLIVLDWDFTDTERPIAEVEMPLADSVSPVSEAEVVTRRLTIKDCDGFFDCLA